MMWCWMDDAAMEVAVSIACSGVTALAVGAAIGFIARHMDRW